MELSWKGLGISVVFALSLGTIFTPEMPQTPDDWYRLAIGFITAVAAQYVLWARTPPNRGEVWTEKERKDVREHPPV